MPTCCQKSKCTQCRCVPCIPRPCIDSHRIPCFNPRFLPPTCYSPFIHSQFPNLTAHCMASFNKSSCCDSDSEDEEKEQEKVKIIKCPYTPSVSQDIDTQEETSSLRTCCVRSVDSKKDLQQGNLRPGFKSRISVDVGNDVQSFTTQTPEAVCCKAIGVSKSLQSVTNQQPNVQSTKKLPTLKEQDTPCPQQCCSIEPKSSKTKVGQLKLSAQGIIKRIDQNQTPTLKNIALSQVPSTESQLQNAEPPCCASAYTKFKSEPILPPKGISATSRPGYVVNKDSPDPMPKSTPSQCMADGGCVHGISSIMPQVKEPEMKTQSPCCCGTKRGSQVCDTTGAREDKKCQCTYPPGFSQFSCAGNITGVCKCTGEFH